MTDSTETPELPPPPAPPEPPPPLAPPEPRSRRELWLEVAAVLAVGVAPNLAASVATAVNPIKPYSYPITALYAMVLNICTIYVVWYLIRRSGEPAGRFGLGRPTLIAMLTIPFVLITFDYYTPQLVFKLFPYDPEVNQQYPTPRGAWDHTLMVVRNGTNGVAEEFVMRGYLITRLAELLRSRGEAVILSAVLFAAYHCDQGGANVIIIFLFGLGFGVTYLCYRNIWPLVLAHWLINIRIELMAA